MHIYTFKILKNTFKDTDIFILIICKSRCSAIGLLKDAVMAAMTFLVHTMKRPRVEISLFQANAAFHMNYFYPLCYKQAAGRLGLSQCHVWSHLLAGCLSELGRTKARLGGWGADHGRCK